MFVTLWRAGQTWKSKWWTLVSLQLKLEQLNRINCYYRLWCDGSLSLPLAFVAYKQKGGGGLQHALGKRNKFNLIFICRKSFLKAVLIDLHQQKDFTIPYWLCNTCVPYSRGSTASNHKVRSNIPQLCHMTRSLLSLSLCRFASLAPSQKNSKALQSHYCTVRGTFKC